MARIAIDEELWRRVRVLAFEEGTSGAEVVNEALRQYLSTPRLVVKPERFPKPETTKDVGAADAAPEEAPPVPAAPPAQEDPWSDLTSQPPSSIGKTISGVEDAKRAVAALPAIRPVPKPTSSKTRSKRSSRSATSGTEA